MPPDGIVADRRLGSSSASSREWPWARARAGVVRGSRARRTLAHLIQLKPAAIYVRADYRRRYRRVAASAGALAPAPIAPRPPHGQLPTSGFARGVAPCCVLIAPRPRSHSEIAAAPAPALRIFQPAPRSLAPPPLRSRVICAGFGLRIGAFGEMGARGGGNLQIAPSPKLQVRVRRRKWWMQYQYPVPRPGRPGWATDRTSRGDWKSEGIRVGGVGVSGCRCRC